MGRAWPVDVDRGLSTVTYVPTLYQEGSRSSVTTQAESTYCPVLITTKALNFCCESSPQLHSNGGHILQADLRVRAPLDSYRAPPFAQ